MWLLRENIQLLKHKKSSTLELAQPNCGKAFWEAESWLWHKVGTNEKTLERWLWNTMIYNFLLSRTSCLYKMLKALQFSFHLYHSPLHNLIQIGNNLCSEGTVHSFLPQVMRGSYTPFYWVNILTGGNSSRDTSSSDITYLQSFEATYSTQSRYTSASLSKIINLEPMSRNDLN